jgi:hypothetical protein
MITPYLYMLFIAISMVALVIKDTVLSINPVLTVITPHLDMVLVTGLMVGFCSKNDIWTI